MATKFIEMVNEEEYDTISVNDESTGIEPESLDESNIITNSYNPIEILIATRQFSLRLLLKLIKNKQLILMPDFERKRVWKEETQSRLIESLLIRIPLPVFYIDATDYDRWLVIDGFQRLTALKRFVLDETLVLNNLEFLPQYNGKKYSELPRPLQRRIEESAMTVIILEPGTPHYIKYIMFKRFNMNSLILSAQEIRHILDPGPVTKLLVELANSKAFKIATNNSIRSIQKEDQEMVLRFLAFATTSYTEYKQFDFNTFLSTKMDEINKMSCNERKLLAKRFKRVMEAAYNIFGDDAFRKRYNKFDKPLLINKALFEVWSVNLDKLTDKQLATLEAQRDIVQSEFINLMNTNKFNDAVSQETGSITKVKQRFKDIEELINKVLL